MLLVDFSLFFYRMYNGAPELSTSEGVSSGFEYMMFKNLELLSRKHGKVILCLDNKGTAERKKIDSKYKETREKSGDKMFPRLAYIMPAIRERYIVAEQEGFEADDIIYILSHGAPEEVSILTNDKDMFQCLSDKVSVLVTGRGKQFVWTPEKLFEEFKVRPWQWLYYRSLIGDPSDNLPGVPRLRKALVAEACRGVIDGPGDPSIELLNEVINYLYRRLEGNEFRNLVDFVKSGQYLSNFQIMQPHIGQITVVLPTPGPEYDRIISQFELSSLKEETEF